MSYFARAARGTAESSSAELAPVLRPALRSDSPLVERDQRLGMGAVSSADIADISESWDAAAEHAGDGEFTADQPLGPARQAPSPGEARAPRAAAPEPDVERISVRVPLAPARSLPDVAPAAPRWQRAAAAEPHDAARAPTSTPAPSLEPLRPLEPLQHLARHRPEAPLDEDAGEASRSQREAAPAPSPAAATFDGAVGDALARIEAWMRAPAKPPESRVRRASSEAAEAVPRTPAQASSASGELPSAAIEAAPPRLTIGRIDVEVVTPPAAPRLVPVRGAARGGAPVRSDGDLGKLGFGLRQR